MSSNDEKKIAVDRIFQKLGLGTVTDEQHNMTLRALRRYYENKGSHPDWFDKYMHDDPEEHKTENVDE